MLSVEFLPEADWQNQDWLRNCETEKGICVGEDGNNNNSYCGDDDDDGY